MLSLTPAEIDVMLQDAKVRLRGHDKPRSQQQQQQHQLLAGAAAGKAFSPRNSNTTPTDENNSGFKTSLMRNRVLMNVFRQINLDNEGLLSASELAYMLKRLEFFVTAAEIQQVQQILDRDSSGSIDRKIVV